MTARIRNQLTATDELVVGQEAFETFYRREFRGVVSLAYALSGSRAGAEDLAQEAFMAAHQRWERISAYDKPAAWVRRVVANMAISAFRRKAAEARALARIAFHRQEALPELEPEDEEFWNLVRGLPAKQSQAIALFYLEDRSVADIAQILECSPATAKVHLFRGRQNLAVKLNLDTPR